MRLFLSLIVAVGCLVALGAAVATWEAPDPNYVTPEYGELLEKYSRKVAECDSIDFARQQALEAKGLAESKLADAQTQIDSLRVELSQSEAELLKARQRPEALPQACAEVPNEVAAVPSAVPYMPRRRLFGRVR